MPNVTRTTYPSPMSFRRDSEDGFNGTYPKDEPDWAEKAYRDAGMEPPWLLEYEDGKVVGPKKPASEQAPRHEA